MCATVRVGTGGRKFVLNFNLASAEKNWPSRVTAEQERVCKLSLGPFLVESFHLSSTLLLLCGLLCVSLAANFHPPV